MAMGPLYLYLKVMAMDCLYCLVLHFSLYEWLAMKSFDFFVYGCNMRFYRF